MTLHFSRARWFVFAGVALISIGLGFAGAQILANETIGYVAVYTWLALTVIGVPLVLSLFLVGAILTLFPRTRWLGILGIMAAALIVTSSFATFKILDALGRVQYKHEQMIPIGPGVKADLVVFFKAEATDDQIYTFAKETISTPKRGGYWPLAGIRDTLYILPIDGHQGYAVTFLPEATEEQRKYVRSRVDASPIVYKVIENVAPANIKKVD